MSTIASQITSLSTVCSAVCLVAHQRKHQIPALLAFVRGIHWWSVDSAQKGPVTRNRFPFNDIIMFPPAVVIHCCDQSQRSKVGFYWWHDDVIKWKHFPRNWPFVRGIHRSPVNSPHRGQWRGALMFSLIYVWINDWVNNREAGDLRRYRAHSDVIVMTIPWLYYRQFTRWNVSSLIQIMACRLVGAKPLSEPMLIRFHSVTLRCFHWPRLPYHISEYSALPIYRGHFSSYNSGKSGVSFVSVSANLTEVLSLQLLGCAYYRTICNRDIWRVSNMAQATYDMPQA